MSSSDVRQWEITKEALKLLFGKNIEITPLEGGTFAVKVDPVVWQPQSLEKCMEYLREETGRNRDIDPFVRPDATSWTILSQFLSRFRLRYLAREVALQYLQVCYDLQEEHEQRIHKGAPLFWVSERFREMDDNDRARGYMLLAFIEDCKQYDDPRTAPAYHRLTEVLGLSSLFLDGLLDYAKKIEPFPSFPEEILVGWELASLPGLGTANRELDLG